MKPQSNPACVIPWGSTKRRETFLRKGFLFFLSAVSRRKRRLPLINALRAGRSDPGVDNWNYVKKNCREEEGKCREEGETRQRGRQRGMREKATEGEIKGRVVVT